MPQVLASSEQIEACSARWRMLDDHTPTFASLTGKLMIGRVLLSQSLFPSVKCFGSGGGYQRTHTSVQIYRCEWALKASTKRIILPPRIGMRNDSVHAHHCFSIRSRHLQALRFEALRQRRQQHRKMTACRSFLDGSPCAFTAAAGRPEISRSMCEGGTVKDAKRSIISTRFVPSQVTIIDSIKLTLTM